ncbi:MAG: TIGR02300 family protein [Rhodospirillales bacterium]|jgi:uncharacterized protein (TIGR02300 family)|nr:TIGR02300 family protein [Rhodospirillales bacterium]MBT3905210.1 TIGR02300 family protein [Rhodospirillaceae bacterium]MBT5033774.1 TIGR02300 family protein [Rhodospirillaceae bacterium]MBT6221726.1 TIGR02300 family protein [Rhodospirillaceae bacterium]MBT6363139.1 TIGR02300 family protein [Rhodospirillaceae bacterium]
MAKPEWGAKVLCSDCGMRFYDLKRDEPECPTCGTVHKAVKVSKPKKAREPEPTPEPKKAKLEADSEEVVEDTGDEALLLADDETDDDLDDGDDTGENGNGIMEDTSDLTADDDDMSEVMEHVEKPEDDRA